MDKLVDNIINLTKGQQDVKIYMNRLMWSNNGEDTLLEKKEMDTNSNYIYANILLTQRGEFTFEDIFREVSNRKICKLNINDIIEEISYRMSKELRLSGRKEQIEFLNKVKFRDSELSEDVLNLIVDLIKEYNLDLEQLQSNKIRKYVKNNLNYHLNSHVLINNGFDKYQLNGRYF